MTHKARESSYFDTKILSADIKNKAVASGGTMILSRFANTIIQMVSTVILARLLTPEDFGLVTMVTAFSLLLFNVGFNGFTEVIIQKENITPQQVSTVFWIGLALSSGLAVLFAACSPLLARFYHEPRVIPITIAMSAGFIFSALATEHLALIIKYAVSQDHVQRTHFSCDQRGRGRLDGHKGIWLLGHRGSSTHYTYSGRCNCLDPVFLAPRTAS